MNLPFSRRTLLLMLLALVVIWFGNLEYRKLIKPDEGRYAEIPREMVVSGDWVTPHLNDFKYFEKPPLQYWATAVAYEVFGEHQWTSRLWTALTGFLGILLTGFVGMRLFGRAAGLYAALILGSSTLYVLMAHVNTLDMGVTFFITLGIFSLLLAQHEQAIPYRRNWMILAWAAMALAVLSKGLMGLILPGAALFLYAAFNRDMGIWWRMNWGTGLLAFFAVVAPWFVLVMQANPEFFQFFFIHEHFERFLTKVHARYQPWHYFVPILLFGMLPWTLLMLDTLLRTWRDSAAQARHFSPDRFLLVWVVFVYIFFSISSSKLPSYLLPMFPALALLMGKQIAEMSARRLFWLIAPVLPLLLVLLFGLGPLVDQQSENPVQHEMYSAYADWLTIAAAIWLVGTGVALYGIRRGKIARSLAVLAVASLLAAQIGITGYNTIARERSGYPIAEAIASLIKTDVPFYSIENYEQTLPFYLKRTFILVDFKDEMAFGIQQEPEKWIPDIPTFIQRWESDKAAYAIMPLRVFPELEKKGLAMKELYRDHQLVVVSKR
ncbi:MAG: glycosyltransferase family 39 protein [Gammaproteobacteria bacterium]|nr:glycosyltransferase family 39 protein [Gammaproteobacteria bacterium]MBU1625239.1 glycosyltransferase family 39 protein [Gammaproteobacteria bacterium]MBU1981499.1 glycosyltransferase family 39 protein [Gammaproteobacteria bacterium]